MSDETAGLAIGISYQCQVGDGRQVVMQTAVALDADQATRDGVLDKLRSMADRQVKFGTLEGIDVDLERNRKGIHDVETGVAVVDEKYENQIKNAKTEREKRLSNQEATARDNLITSLKHLNSVEDKLLQKKRKLQEELGVA